MKKNILSIILSATLILGIGSIPTLASANCPHSNITLMERSLMSITYVDCRTHDHCYIGTNHYYCRYQCNKCGENVFRNSDETFHTYPH